MTPFGTFSEDRDPVVGPLDELNVDKHCAVRAQLETFVNTDARNH